MECLVPVLAVVSGPSIEAAQLLTIVDYDNYHDNYCEDYDDDL